VITEGLIAIGILALIAAILLVRGKGKTSQTNQQAMPKRAADKQAVVLTKPSVLPKTQASFPGPQVPFPVSAANKQTMTFAEPSTSTQTLAPFSAPEVSFPGSTADKQAVTFAESSVSTPTQAPFPGPQVPFSGSTANNQAVVLAEPSVLTQAPEQLSSPVQTPPVVQTPDQKAELDQTQVPVDLNDQLTAKPDQGLSEMQTPSSIPSGVAPLSPSNPASKSLRHSPSIDQQMAELIADTWALQQQATEIGRRLNYLSTCIQYSSASEPHEPNTDGNG